MNFILKMAWRDTRASRRRLLLFSLAIVLGVAALVAVGSVRDNLRLAIEQQTKSLLGADLTVNSRTEFPEDAAKHFATLGEDRAREISFNSMLIVPREGGPTRLVQVRAIEGEFPFYGDFDTEPAGARASLRDGMNAVLEESLMVQFGLKAGDSVRLGTAIFTVAGGLRAIPGEAAAVTQMAPRVFVPLATVGGTGLLKQGSLSRHRLYFKFPEKFDVQALERDLRERFREHRFGYDTVEERKRELGQSIQNVNAFLSLVGFASLFLGAIGVASAIHAHIRQKIPTVAMLRCLGATARTALAIYLVQGLSLGLIGATLGALLGLGVQMALPMLVNEFLPFTFELAVSWGALFRGLGAGVVVSVLFALLPLLEVRRVSPLLTLRSAYVAAPGRDLWQLGLLVVIGCLVFGFAWWQTGRLQWGLGFSGALLVSFGVLAGLARVVSWLARRFTPRGLPYAWRQGVANLHRPNNRTLLLLVSLGLGTFLMMTLYLSRDTLIGQLRVVGGGDRPNLMLFDIQDDQVEPLKKLLADNGAPVRQHAPIITMRIASVKGRATGDILKEKDSRVPAWTLRREYRSTYRRALTDSEKVTAGTFTGRVTDEPEVVPVSMDENLARDLQVALGDEIVFDVQGVPVKAKVDSLRQVDWRRMQANFFLVFPEGALEAAPKFHIMALRVADATQSARVQQAVVRDHPNVSAIDLALIIRTIDGVYTKASFVVEFLALFTVITGGIVLAGAVLIGRSQRVRESVLLRTLGATKAQVNRIMFAEYLALGTLAAAVGAVLAVGANWALAWQVFQVKWTAPSAGVLLGGWAVVSALTVLTGWISNRGICDHPPLAVLREET
ncbi:FtsX-like permease family protein [Oleiharenicola lentus]|uniref:FtsX-like permease family protein n=1 Tax=Oleiharenicola lentus TaxID=2508720 RepID=A0A4V1M6K9_9BACT|nr:FtsX-like permease family protein [Oleiharenicola lentus]RXK55759.1 FtsX-like permease family protein [Oleiharenicola lentus]